MRGIFQFVMLVFRGVALPRTISSPPEKRPSQKERIVFLPSIFSCENVSFQGWKLHLFPDFLAAWSRWIMQVNHRHKWQIFNLERGVFQGVSQIPVACYGFIPDNEPLTPKKDLVTLKGKEFPNLESSMNFKVPAHKGVCFNMIHLGFFSDPPKGFHPSKLNQPLLLTRTMNAPFGGGS